jgi:hypothetical protein
MTNWSELSIFVSAVTGCIVSLVIAIQKSKCTKIKICRGCCECDRNINVNNDLENQLSNVEEITPTISTTPQTPPNTPRESEPKRKSHSLARYERAIHRTQTPLN